MPMTLPSLSESAVSAGLPGPTRKARIIAIINNKGGVGKTVVVGTLAAALARLGRRVLVIDLDGQGNLTRRMGYDEATIKVRPTMAEVLAQESAELLRKIILPCQWEEDWAELISIAPARKELDARVSEAAQPGAFLRLRDVLEPIAGEWDDILIDTPPSLGHLVHMALAAAEHVVAVTEPETDAIRGAMRIRDTIADPKMRAGLALRCNLDAVVINGQRAGVLDEVEQVARIRAIFGDLVVKTVIPLRAPIASTVERAMSPTSATDPTVRTLIADAGTGIIERLAVAA